MTEITYGDVAPMSLDQLAVLVASSPGVRAFGSSEPTEEEKRELGMALFKRVLAAAKDRLCGERLRVVAASDEATIVSRVADLIASFAGGLPVVALAMMVVKYGLKRICDEQQQDPV